MRAVFSPPEKCPASCHLWKCERCADHRQQTEPSEGCTPQLPCVMFAACHQGIDDRASACSIPFIIADGSVRGRNPFAFQVGVSTVKTSAADIMTQTCVEGKAVTEIDVKRNLVFVVFGAVYLGGFQWWIQVTQFRKWFPGMDRFANATLAEKLKDTQGMMSAAKQVLFDVFVHLPFMYFPAFYTAKEFCQGTSWNPVDWVKDGCSKYYKNFAKDTYAMFCLWAPADVVLFSLPIWLRMPCRHVVSFVWTAYVSFLRGSKIPAIEAKKE